MNDRDDRDTSSTTLPIVLVVVVLLLALPCLAVVGIFAMRLLWVAHPVMIEPPPPVVERAERMEPQVPPPVEPAETATKEGK